MQGIRRSGNKAQFPFQFVFELYFLAVIIICLQGQSGKERLRAFASLIPVVGNIVLRKLQIAVARQCPEVRLEHKQVFLHHFPRTARYLQNLQDRLLGFVLHKLFSLQGLQSDQISLVLFHQIRIFKIKRKQLPVNVTVDLLRTAEILQRKRPH